jgi:DNA invertase Pin-like site-specific DNA recombinase
MIRARTCAALAAKRARRERVGSVPYGFALDGDGVHLVAVRTEQATVARARELRAAGLSLRAIAASLATEVG